MKKALMFLSVTSLIGFCSISMAANAKNSVVYQYASTQQIVMAVVNQNSGPYTLTASDGTFAGQASVTVAAGASANPKITFGNDNMISIVVSDQNKKGVCQFDLQRTYILSNSMYTVKATAANLDGQSPCTLTQDANGFNYQAGM